MISTTELKKIAKARLTDANVLFENTRYDGSVYLCGYAVELALKHRICKTLKWLNFPETNAEFRNLQSFKTHDLDVLLQLSGFHFKMIPRFTSEWSVVSIWNPEIRYNRIGTTSATHAQQMLLSSHILVEVLCGK